MRLPLKLLKACFISPTSSTERQWMKSSFWTWFGSHAIGDNKDRGNPNGRAMMLSQYESNLEHKFKYSSRQMLDCKYWNDPVSDYAFAGWLMSIGMSQKSSVKLLFLKVQRPGIWTSAPAKSTDSHHPAQLPQHEPKSSGVEADP